jgi:dTDP-4-dehydrorhamnose reductase
MIHITTDCVFSGKDGSYDEESSHDCLDEYGKSKSLGESQNLCMTIRTSIIGDEIHKNASLIAWAKSMKDKEVKGFTNHFWNGITTRHYAEICEQIIQNNLYTEGLFHIHSNSVSKFELLNLLNERYGLNLDIKEFRDKNTIDRTLSTKKQLLSKLNMKTIQQQIKEL